MGYFRSWGDEWVDQVRYAVGSCWIQAILQGRGLLLMYVQSGGEVLATIPGEH